MMNKLNRIMILKDGCIARHNGNDIKSFGNEFIYVNEEHDDHYVGHFVEGFGMINVVYNKSDVRPLTEEEIKKYSSLWLTIDGKICWQSILDSEGNIIKPENN